MAGDTMVAVVLAAFEFLTRDVMPDEVSSFWFWAVGLGLLAPLVVRRRYPVQAAYLILAAGFVQLVTHGPLGEEQAGRTRLADLALALALYTLVAYVGRKQAALYAVWLTIGTVAWVFPRVAVTEAVLLFSVIAIVFALHWALGEFAGARRAYHVEVERRLDLLETERDQQARIAVAEERARIARELHDVVAHAVSVIVVQADGAAYAVRSQPELAEKALETISGTGREALTELRRLLGVLRSENSETERVPQPGTRSLSELADRVRATGVPVRLDLSGELDSLPAGIGLGIYRIVQEALTNTIKHAGVGAKVKVSVLRVGDHVELDVVDRGPGRAVVPGLTSGGGNGLIGMRERASVFGGSLNAGPLPEGGGWQVRAVLPVAERLG
ncbi:sensor histidine kinase [Actinokineospora sp. G85]|uniref:sensor histidine kinase n=1 Tax=Actinokineospora sp. G85 TaxID=3406626 RepID=UPI003C756666